jgi:hypothetical protein
MKKIIYLFLFTIFLYSSVFCQKGEVIQSKVQNDNEATRIEYLKNMPLHGFFGISFSNSVPQKEYMNNLQTSGPGFGLYGGYRFEPVPVTLGGTFDMLFFGSDTKYYEHYLNNGWVYARDTLSTTNWSMPFTAFVRFEPNIKNLFYPYLEAFAGFTLMDANASYKAFTGTESTQDEFSANFNYGVGAGAMIKLVDFVMLPNQVTRMLLDVRFKYLLGTEANYFDISVNNDGSVNFKKFRSKTNQILCNIGIVFHFGGSY